MIQIIVAKKHHGAARFNKKEELEIKFYTNVKIVVILEYAPSFQKVFSQRY